MTDVSRDSHNTLEAEAWRRPLVRAALAFLIFVVFGLAFRVCFPSQYSDNLLGDYTNLSAAHAIRYLENDLGDAMACSSARATRNSFGDGEARPLDV